jgi:cell division protein FtsB
MKLPTSDQIPLWNQLPAWVRNKYFLVLLSYGIYMFFFDSNDIRSQIQLRMELSKLENQVDYYKEQLAQVKEERTLLFSDPRSMEKFARENYLMKKDDETVFVIVEEEEKK